MGNETTLMKANKSGYRPDIDGLRAIAVLTVIFFHLGINRFKGGFVGVDVFFVISGFLITSILVREMDNKHFSIVTFYERRARRIAPALFAVIAVSLVSGFFLFLPDDLISLGRSALAAVFMIANLYWWFEGDYFSAPLDTKPLLHTWSLGVEEQFYLFLPLIIWILSIKSLRVIRPFILLLLLVVSFAACAITTFENNSLAFYWLPFRAWELLIGGMIVFLPKSEKAPNWIAAILSFLGLIAIIITALKVRQNGSFPGFIALAPVLGSAFIIWAGTGRNPATNRFLSLSPFVWIGLISYSLYLWHWPIIVFMRYWAIEPLNIIGITVVLALTFFISALSYLYIEQPFRNKNWITKKGIFTFTVVGAVIIGLIGFGLSNRKGVPARLSEQVVAYSQAVNDQGRYQTHCLYGKTPPELDPMGACHIGADNIKPNFLVWGDSFSGAVSPGLDDYTNNTERSGLMVGAAACMPILGVGTAWEPSKGYCRNIQDNVLSVIDDLKPDTVILVSNWSMMQSGDNFRWITAENRGDFFATFEAAFDLTIAELRKRHVKIIIVTHIPLFEEDVPRKLARQAMLNKKPDVTISLEKVFLQNTQSDRMFEKYRHDKDIEFISPTGILCPEAICRAEKNGHALYFDMGHFTTYGSKVVSPMFKPLLVNPPKIVEKINP